MEVGSAVNNSPSPSQAALATAESSSSPPKKEEVEQQQNSAATCPAKEKAVLLAKDDHSHDPSSTSFAFGDMNAIILKGMRGPISSDDMYPLAPWMRSEEVLDRFDRMMTRVVWRVPEKGCFTDAAASLDGASPSHQNEPFGGAQAADTNAAAGTSGTAGKAATTVYMTMSAALSYITGPLAALNAKRSPHEGPINNFKGSAAATTAGAATASTAGTDGSDATVVIANAKDRMRLYMHQDTSLVVLLLRFSAYHITVALVLGLGRTAFTILQVWALWTIIRIVNDEGEYGDYSTGVQYVIALLLPFSTFVYAGLQHNTFHISARSAIVCRAAVVALIFEKLRLITPMHLGAASKALGMSGAEKDQQAKEEKDAAQEAVGGVTVEGHGASGSSSVEMMATDFTATEADRIQKEKEAAAKAQAAADAAHAHDNISAGKLINLVSSDANSLVEAFITGPFTVACGVDLVMCVVWIGWVFGWAAAPLTGAIAVMMAVQFFFGDRVAANKSEVARVGDQRLRSLTEFLCGIQVVKFYAWEVNVRKMIGALRTKEAALHVAGNVWKLLGLASIFFVGAIFSLVVFAVKLTYDTSMNAADVFVTMTLVGIAGRSFAMVPRALTGMATAYASMQRIQAFLAKDVISGLPTPVTADSGDADEAATDDANGPVAYDPLTADASIGGAATAAGSVQASIDRGLRIVGDYGWTGFVLKDVNLVCPEGSLTVIIGSVGSGKSTLLQAVLGVCSVFPPSPQSSAEQSNNHHHHHRPIVRLPAGGRVAYVSQEAFIAESTVRDNITFGKPFDEAKYRRVIKACSLVTDFQQWGGDLVEVTGNTLSGGQRQRLSLARACYADADLYIVDDPISAVDASVGRHLLRHCFRGYLRGKTVLLATHHPAPARFADQVVIMEHGAIRVCHVSEAAKEAARVLTSESLARLSGDSTHHTHHDGTGSVGDGGGGPSSVRNASFNSATKEDLVDAMRRLEAEERASTADGTATDLGGESDLDEDDAMDDGAGTPQRQTTLVDDEGNVIKTSLTLDQILDGLIGKARELRLKEVEEAGSVSLDVYRAYINGGGWSLAIITLTLFITAQGVRTVHDWWFSAWTKREFKDLSNDQYLYILGILVACIVVLSFSRTIIFGFFTINASSSLHDRMFEAVIASPLHFFEQVPIGRIMNRFSKDLDYCDDLLPRTLFDFMQNILTIMGALALLVYSVPWFAIAIPFALVIFYFLIRAYMPTSRYMKRIEGTSRSPTMNTFQTVMNGLTTLRVYNRIDHFQQHFFETTDLTTNALLYSNATQRWMGMRMDWVAIMWIGVVSILCIAMQDSLGPSIVGLCLSQSLSFTGLLQFAVRMAAETENLMTSVERLDEYSKLPLEENKGTIMVADSRTLTHEQSAAVAVGSTALPASWPEGADIIAKDLSIAYASNPGVNVLKNLHFKIKPGQRVAVVGRTGAGKSSLLAAFYRTVAIPDGSIAIGGVSTTDMDVFCLRSKLGIIPQVPTLFHGTFRYNLDPFGLYTDEAMLESLKKVRLDSYVAARHGLDTTVGDGGGNLSVGQRQLLCAARVLLTGATILFMDEATANIDEETDAQIQQIMRDEAASRQMTIITIAHRLNTIMDYDLVLVLSRGRLVEHGNPRELVAAGTFDAAATAQDVADREALERDGDGGCIVRTSACGHFVTNVRSADEIRQFAQMVHAMNEAHHEH